jgi:hypothetical protein
LLGANLRLARLSGMTDLDAVEDRSRRLRRLSTWESPADAVREAAEIYMVDPWLSQAAYVEVWIEKEALTGVIADTCERWRVPYYSPHGYDSVTLGDHDPSGVHMGEQLEKFLALILDDSDDEPMSEERFKRLQHLPIDGLGVRRIALTMDQVRRHSPPPNPVKDGDSRAAAYVDRFGTDECWELDALEPQVIAALVESEVKARLNMRKWRQSLGQERRDRAKLEELADDFE